MPGRDAWTSAEERFAAYRRPRILGLRAAVTGRVDPDLKMSGWFWLTCVAVVSTVVATLSFFAGLRRTGASATAILSTFEPVVTTALATLTLGESLSGVQLLGGALVLTSVVMLQLHQARRPRRHSVVLDDAAITAEPSRA
jgi:drug/metabolite transporter (DMT)-like permease